MEARIVLSSRFDRRQDRLVSAGWPRRAIRTIASDQYDERPIDRCRSGRARRSPGFAKDNPATSGPAKDFSLSRFLDHSTGIRFSLGRSDRYPDQLFFEEQITP